MGAWRGWFGDGDLGEVLGIGLSTNQIAHLAGALFLALFAVSALRRVSRAPGPLPAVWMAIAVGLLAGAFLVTARGFPDEIPDELKPWTDPDRLTRAAAVLALLGCSLVLLSAHWASAPLGRLAYRLIGLGTAGLAVWLAAGWFSDQLPEEMREWTAQVVVMRAVVVLALLFLAGAFWVRRSESSPHVRWLNRTLTPPAILMAVLLALGWFGPRLPAEVPQADVRSVVWVLGAVATGTCLLIAGGAYLIRERAAPNRPKAPPPPLPPLPLAETGRPLPVAVLLDDQGTPIRPATAPRTRQTGPSGA